MKFVRSLLVLLSVGACALAAPTASTPETSGNISPGSHISTPLIRDKKSTPGTCITVSEPYKAPFTICNGATASAVSALTHGGDGDAAKHLGGESPHNQANGISAHGSGFNGIHGASTSAHIASGGPFTSHQHAGGPHIAVHPALHTAISSHHGLPGAGYGLSGYGFPYGGQGFIPTGGAHYGFVPNRFDVMPPYGSFSYGVSPIDLYRATDNVDSEDEAAMAAAPNAEKDETVVQEQISQSTEDERVVVAAALEEEAVAEALEQFRATQMEAERQVQIERALEESARSAVLAPSYAPLPVINDYLQTLPVRGGYAASVFPSIPGGGGCGALPLLFSCTPQLVRGRLVHYPAAGWHGGAALHSVGGGGSYRQTEQHAGSVPASAPHSSKDTVVTVAGSTKTNKMDAKKEPEKDLAAQRGQEKMKAHVEKPIKSPETTGSSTRKI